jgi:two-component system, NarL family, nitrate/nitrite response regulator NarL
MTATRLFLVDRSLLFREALQRVVGADGWQVVGEAATLASAVERVGTFGAVDLIVFDFAPEEECGSTLGHLRQVCPAAKFVVLTSEVSRQSLAKAVEWAVDAYLLKDLSAEALARSFQLIMLGQQIFPTKCMMSMLYDQSEQSYGALDGVQTSGLSPRELQILRALVNGKSNKAIARDLNVAEATVKVHLKALLRKARVHNRTQAAVWALNQGITHVA